MGKGARGDWGGYVWGIQASQEELRTGRLTKITVEGAQDQMLCFK